MEGFDHILNWKLLRGSHEFPGKDGGTCINEAALVAAGFKYRRNSSHCRDATLLFAPDLPVGPGVERRGEGGGETAPVAVRDAVGLRGH